MTGVIDKENLHNVRRVLESGLKMAQDHMEIYENKHLLSRYIDVFQHALDELKRSGLDFPDEKIDNGN